MQTLTEDEREDWDAYRLQRLTESDAGSSITLDDFQQRLIDLRSESTGNSSRLALLDELEQWADHVMDASG